MPKAESAFFSKEPKKAPPEIRDDCGSQIRLIDLSFFRVKKVIEDNILIF